MYKDFMAIFHETITSSCYVVGGSGPLKAIPASVINSTLSLADGSASTVSDAIHRCSWRSRNTTRSPFAMSCSTVTLAYRFPSLLSEGRFSEMMARLPTSARAVSSEITPTFRGTMLSLVFLIATS
jgi:hypothetical protein